MPRTTASFDGEQHSWIAKMADRLNRSQSEVIGGAVDVARGAESPVAREILMESDDIRLNQGTSENTNPHLEDRLTTLEDRLAALEAAAERGAATDGRGEVEPPDYESAEPTNGATGRTAPREAGDTRAEPSTAGLAETIPAQLPKDCPDADAEAVVAIAEFLRDEPDQWASPQEIRDAVHDEYPAGKENPEWWWKRMREWLEHVDEVEYVHQRRVEWAAPQDVDAGEIYDPTEEF